MAKYRKRPIVIEAQQFTEENKDRVFNFVTCTRIPQRDKGKLVLVIQTLEGDMTAAIGDWIIKGVKGEFYPCKPDIFEATYEKVQQDELKETEIEKLAKKAARTGNRSDLQAYLKARRNND